MSTIPAFINAIFTLNKKGEFPLYEGDIEGGYTKVSVISRLASGYSTRYYKVKQIIAFEGQQAIVQSFDLPSQEFAYRLIEKAIVDNSYTNRKGDNEKLEVVATGQQTTTHTESNTTRVEEVKTNSEYINNSASTYKPVISSQSKELGEAYTKGKGFVPDYNDSSFDSLQSFTGTGSDGFDSSEIKVANMSSFTHGQSSSRSRNNSYSSLEDALDSGF